MPETKWTHKQVMVLIGAISMALGGAAGTVAGDAQSANKVGKLEKRSNRIERNQIVLDKSVRGNTRQGEWNSDKLDAVLRAMDADIPERPPMPISELEKPE